MKRILSIDGGGIRGLLPAIVLAKLEAETGKRTADLFDLIAGNSTGGILACGLAARVLAPQLVSVYADHGAEIFDGGVLTQIETEGAYKFDAGPLERRLQQALGSVRLSEPPTRLLVPSYDMKLPGAVFFKSWKAGDDPLLWQVARATSAAPTYFPPFELGKHTYIDGGVHTNNPSMAAIAEVWNLWPGEEIRCVSLGTGTVETPMDPSGWTIADWAVNLVGNILLDAPAQAATYEAKSALSDKYLRCDVATNEKLPSGATASQDFTDASAENVAALKELGSVMADRFLAQIRALLGL